MKHFFLAILATILLGSALAASSGSASAAGSVGLPNPLRYEITPGPSCKASTYKPKWKRGIKLAWATSKARSGKSWGPTAYSANGDTKTTRYYHNYPLVVDRFTHCRGNLVRNTYYPTKYKRFHLAQTFVKRNLSAWTPSMTHRTPVSGYTKCFRAYHRPSAFNTWSTCNGYDLNLSR